MRVIAQQGDTLDSLCWTHLGSSAAVEESLRLNPGLAAIGAILPIGTAVILPDASPAAPAQNIIQLWD